MSRSVFVPPVLLKNRDDMWWERAKCEFAVAGRSAYCDFVYAFAALSQSQRPEAIRIVGYLGNVSIKSFGPDATDSVLNVLYKHQETDLIAKFLYSVLIRRYGIINKLASPPISLPDAIWYNKYLNGAGNFIHANGPATILYTRPSRMAEVIDNTSDPEHITLVLKHFIPDGDPVWYYWAWRQSIVSMTHFIRTLRGLVFTREDRDTPKALYWIGKAIAGVYGSEDHRNTIDIIYSGAMRDLSKGASRDQLPSYEDMAVSSYRRTTEAFRASAATWVLCARRTGFQHDCRKIISRMLWPSFLEWLVTASPDDDDGNDNRETKRMRK